MPFHKELSNLLGSLEFCSSIRSISKTLAELDNFIQQCFIMCTLTLMFPVFTSIFTPMCNLADVIAWYAIKKTSSRAHDLQLNYAV